MSIVHDFKDINSRLRGDDWWEPAKMEAQPDGSGWGSPVITGAIPVGGGMTMAEIEAVSNKAIEYFFGTGAVMYQGVIIRQVADLDDDSD